MSEQSKTEEQAKGLKILLKPFEPNEISKLPKATKAQNDQVKKDYTKGTRCAECGGWHLPAVVHLDYVGHAALTKRLLEADPLWNWTPITMQPDGSPTLDSDGGMWIFLTVCGVTRRGYGDAQGKTGPNATKERIGDALRNAAMRFGAALDLWHKGDLHQEDDGKENAQNVSQGEQQQTQQARPVKEGMSAASSWTNALIQGIDQSKDLKQMNSRVEASDYKNNLADFPDFIEKVDTAIDQQMFELSKTETPEQAGSLLDQMS